jgi:2-polyprenyl-3-methyl-5-hydroxy-6-metoxy-1,4-benzoquinol methylase
MLAVLEHIPEPQQRPLAESCARFLKPAGVLVITTPSPRVDRILNLLLALRLIDGMSLEEHYGFDPRQTPALFSVPG